MDRDRLELLTPDGITLELTLAGIGTRGIAAIIDALLQGLSLFALTFFFNLQGGGPVGSIAILVGYVLILIGYHIVFEVWGSGQTIGKRMMHIRVLGDDGGPVGFVTSVLRTFMRIVDFLPLGYVVGIVAVFGSGRNQRLGDMAAGTIVVLEPRIAAPPAVAANGQQSGLSASVPQQPWDVSQVTVEEVALLKHFLSRRTELDPVVRSRHATNLAGRIDDRVIRPSGQLTAETIIEQVVAAKDRR